MDLFPLLHLMVDEGASDLYLSVGAAPHIKVKGHSRATHDKELKDGDVKAMAYSILNQHQMKLFEATLECNVGFKLEGVGRFRVNVYYERGEVAMVVRLVKAKIPSLKELGLPPVVARMTMIKRGLVLAVGAAGSGKSTTLASMIDFRATYDDGHILTIEDPIEFNLAHKRSLITQREVGVDTLSFADALHNALREAPDVIMIGEIRDRETMQQAITYAETGHLCLSTLHANNANQAIQRITNFFPECAHQQILNDLSLNLQGIISQRLVPGKDGELALACEILLWSSYVSDLIQNGKISEIKDVMVRSRDQGMQSFDQSLYELFSLGKISDEEALRNADSRTDLGLRIRLGEHRPN